MVYYRRCRCHRPRYASRGYINIMTKAEGDKWVDGSKTVWAKKTLVLASMAFIVNGSVYPQSPTTNEIKGKIFDAKMAQQTFAKGLKHCNALDGTNFYFEQRDRVLNLEDYHRALTSLVAQQAFNPETKRPWNQQDADIRWDQVKKQALSDKANCALIASLPDLQKQLDDLEKSPARHPTGNKN